jgi:hypothetical protein
MAISDFISTSFLFSIAIIVILIGGIFAYVSYRMSEQDHKFSSMLGLVSTMADEIHELKNKTVVSVNQHHHQHKQDEKYNYEDDDEEVGLKKHSLGGNPKLIHVSDDEETSSEYEDDESEAETVEDSEADDDESETDAEDSEAESVSEADDLEDNINLDNDINILDLEDMSNELTQEADETNNELIDLVDVNETNDDAVNDIKSIHLAEPINMHLDELSPVEITNDLKTISISMTDIGMNINDFGDDSSKHKSVDYKKMSLIKLRDIVVEKGIIPDASKLKKNELLKLLGEE